MGCGSSSQPISNRSDADNADLYDLIINAKCPHIRLDQCDDMKHKSIKGITYNYDLDFCYVSQRGYYPNGKYIL